MTTLNDALLGRARKAIGRMPYFPMTRTGTPGAVTSVEDLVVAVEELSDVLTEVAAGGQRRDAELAQYHGWLRTLREIAVVVLDDVPHRALGTDGGDDR